MRISNKVFIFVTSIKRKMAELNLILSKEEQKFQEYLNYLKILAEPTPPKATLISNKGERHASILMGALLNHTEKCLKMYCTGLTPTILHGEGEECTAYWRVFIDFFEKTVDHFGNGSVQILVQSKAWENYPPFEVVKNAMKQYPNKIEIKVENSKSREIVNNYWGKDDSINFSIYDKNAYRLEYEPSKHKAIASFFDPRISNELTLVFDKMFVLADKYVCPS